MVNATAVIVGVSVLVVAILIFLIFLSPFYGVYNPANLNTNIKPTYLTPYGYNYSDYLLSENPVDFSTYDECAKLKYAVKNAVLSGRPYKVDEIKYGTYSEWVYASTVPLPIIGRDCHDEELQTSIVKGLNQTVCKFKQITANVYDPDSLPYGGISDAAGFDFENCTYLPSYSQSVDLKYKTIFGSNVVGPVEDLNHPSTTLHMFYSSDSLYIRNGDYSHSIYNNVSAFNSAYYGPGTLKIYVGKAASKNGECVFNTYFCYKPAIAKYVENKTIDIFNIFRDLEVTNLNNLPYYIRNLTEDSNPVIDYSRSVYYWNYYDVKLDGDYRVENIINAIKSGLALNVLGKGLFFAHPHWDILKDSSINKAGECWKTDFDNLIKSPPFPAFVPFFRTRSIRFNCGADNICSGDLRIKVALRHDFRDDLDIDGDSNNDMLDCVSGVISFCDQ